MLYRIVGHRGTTRFRNTVRFGWLPLVLAATIIQAAPLDPPTPEAVAEARQIVQQMKASPRGPYSRVVWYCNDGSVQPPVAYACRERGGGRQHAEYSPERQRLVALGWSAGTIFAALGFDELFESRMRQGRLRELPLERYLVDIDNGWVLERAMEYRGRVQIEDENAAGSALLEQLLTHTDWVQDNFLLVREAVRSIPHGADSDLARNVRRDAISLAEMEPAAERWRAEIHSQPSRDIAGRLRAWAGSQPREDVAALARALADDLELLYGVAGRRARIDEALAATGRSAAASEWRDKILAALELGPFEQVEPICRLLTDARTNVFEHLSPLRRIALLDALGEIEASVQLSFQEQLVTAALTRHELLVLAAALADCGHASGLLSAREATVLKASTGLSADDVVSLADYRKTISVLKRAPGWALGTVRHTFAEPLIAYTALDSRAGRFSDDLLRGSPLWMYGDVLKRLSRDADRLAGSVTEVLGASVGTAVALNPGVGRGTLRIFETIEAVEHAELGRSDIVVLPETVAELSPVAGILTLGEGNALSHVQLLARNFGIPNVAIDFEIVDALKESAGQEVLLVVGSGGDVLVRPVDDDLRSILEAGRTTGAMPEGGIEVPVPELSMNRVLVLDEIGRQLSGRVVGPKAANLGELNRLFPGRVAPALAIPFGIYADHLRAAGLDMRIADTFAQRASGSLGPAEADAELAAIRSEITALEINADTRRELASLMEREFGEAGSYGVFVRSDTNVEDLPQFTGAGLNETIANVVGTDAQLAAVPRVWSSVLSPRALAWRASVLANPARIYASVLLMKSVPSTKSGVLVTTNLADRSSPGLTASAAWGVGGAVAGEAAETLVILPASTELVSEAKSPYRRYLAGAGGVDWAPASAGQVLDPAEVDALRALAAEVEQKYAPVFADDGAKRPWDIEFGFVDGELTLFQIRPLVERAGRNADSLIRQLRPEQAGASPAVSVSIDDLPGSASDAN